MGTQYFNCIGLGTIAQRLKKAITERCRLTIDGKLQARVNEKDGKKYVNTTIVIDDFQMTAKGSDFELEYCEHDIILAFEK